MLIKMCKENSYAKMEKLGAEICRCTRQGRKVMPCGVVYVVTFDAGTSRFFISFS